LYCWVDCQYWTFLKDLISKESASTIFQIPLGAYDEKTYEIFLSSKPGAVTDIAPQFLFIKMDNPIYAGGGSLHAIHPMLAGSGGGGFRYSL
jgi:hypothetical protein